MIEQIQALQQRAKADLEAVRTGEALEAYRIQYLGSKGEVKALMTGLKDVPREDKPAAGKAANEVRQEVEAAYAAREAELAGGGGEGAGQGDPGSKLPGRRGGGLEIDVTEPGAGARLGREHPITTTIYDILDVFGRMGFDAVEGPEVEDEYHNFVALNIPAEHPARDPLDNFYLTDPEGENPSLLRSQTSTVQVRVMERTQPPVRIVSTGRVYRPDEHDATHYSMFHQVEGLYVDKDVSMRDLKTTLYHFARAYFGEDADIKLVPSYFPFTEPLRGALCEGGPGRGRAVDGDRRVRDGGPRGVRGGGVRPRGVDRLRLRTWYREDRHAEARHHGHPLAFRE